MSVDWVKLVTYQNPYHIILLPCASQYSLWCVVQSCFLTAVSALQCVPSNESRQMFKIYLFIYSHPCCYICNTGHCSGYVSFVEYELFRGGTYYINTVIQCTAIYQFIYSLYAFKIFIDVGFLSPPLLTLHQLLIVSISKFTEFNFPLSWKVIFRILDWILELWCIVPCRAQIQFIFVYICVVHLVSVSTLAN
jgi:hypothetical protein